MLIIKIMKTLEMSCSNLRGLSKNSILIIAWGHLVYFFNMSSVVEMGFF